MNNHWQPSTTVKNLQKRAALLAQIRQFFAERNVLEVDTPILSQAAVTDLHLHSFTTYVNSGKQQIPAFLHTSPEYAMKRLLAAGSGDIYQICKVFRQEELGRLHQPEFTMLEWYRLNFDHHQLMHEIDELLQIILHTKSAEKSSYREAFLNYCDVDPHQTTQQQLEKLLPKFSLQLTAPLNSPDDYLQLLFSHCIEPHLGKTQPTFIYDFPASQAALAKLRPCENYQVAERFELYMDGIELANGFHELQDAKEQRARFLNDLHLRVQYNLPAVPIDENFLAALTHGLPLCSGVALGVDRLLMVALKAQTIDEVVSFGWERV